MASTVPNGHSVGTSSSKTKEKAEAHSRKSKAPLCRNISNITSDSGRSTSHDNEEPSDVNGEQETAKVTRVAPVGRLHVPSATAHPDACVSGGPPGSFTELLKL